MRAGLDRKSCDAARRANQLVGDFSPCFAHWAPAITRNEWKHAIANNIAISREVIWAAQSERCRKRLKIANPCYPAAVSSKNSTRSAVGTVIADRPPPKSVQAELASRPAESHRRPLIDPSVRLSPHWAPIMRTSRVCRSSNVRTTQGVLEIIARGRDRPWPYDP